MQEIEIITLNKPGVTDFAKERNDLLEKAKSKWVFFLDSDEAISKTLADELKTLDLSKYDGFYVKRDNYFLGKYAGTDNILRLARKNSGKWRRMVHEIWQVKGKIGQLRNPIRHNTAESISEMLEKINRYSTLHAEANGKEGKKSNIFKIIFMPKIKFIQSLFMGKSLVLSILMAFHSFLSWSKLWISQRD